MPNRVLKRLLVAVVAAASVSCGDVVRSGRAPVFLVINSLEARRGSLTTGAVSDVLLSDVLTGGIVFADGGQVSISASLKDVTSPTGPTTNNAVTITRYRVTYRRGDGRNTPGLDVPYAFDGAATGTVSVGGSLQLRFELVRNQAKVESPLIQLQNSLTVIGTIADVTFYGQDQVGNEVNVTGHISVEFADFGDS
jgi:hypothetical protein